MQSTSRASPPHAYSQWTLSSGRGSCSGSGWACGPSRRWHTELPGIRTGHVPAWRCPRPGLPAHSSACGSERRSCKSGPWTACGSCWWPASYPRDGGQHCWLIRGGASGSPWPGPLPVALIPGLDNALLHLKPKAEECFQLGDSDRLKILGVVWSELGLLDLFGSQVCLAAQEPPEIGIKEQLEEGKCGALVVDVVWDILWANNSLHGTVCRPEWLALTSPCWDSRRGLPLARTRLTRRTSACLRGSPGGWNPSRPGPPKSKCRRYLRCRCQMGTSSHCQGGRRWLDASFSWGR